MKFPICFLHVVLALMLKRADDSHVLAEQKAKIGELATEKT